ncbi:MAG: energy transducer TonB [Prolixibacteraceae bacterium]|jgi:protein TonB|nr:energy transducer TonB [Prolixibacteraceae bacterium]
MKTKKTKKADLENKRPLFFSVGLLISLSAVLFAFGWKTPMQKAEISGELKWEAPVEEMLPVIKEEKKEVTTPKREAIDFELVDDETEIDSEIDFFESEIENDEAVDIRFYVPHTTEKEEDVPVWFADEMPEFPGGMPSLLKFIASSLRYPVVAQENGIQGKVFVTFVINKTGEVTGVRILRGIDPALDAEALRVVKNLPRWKPGRQSGKPVSVNYNVPIHFILK